MNDKEIQWLEKLSKNPHYKMTTTQERKLAEYHATYKPIEIKPDIEQLESKPKTKRKKKTTGKKKTTKNVIEIDEKIIGLLEES